MHKSASQPDTYYRYGTASLPAILELIKRAEREILIAPYNFGADHWGRCFFKALDQKAKSGVKVRLLVDAMGSFGSIRTLRKWFASSPVEFRVFRPIRRFLFHPIQSLCRAHARLFMIDRKIFGTGGIGLGDDYWDREDFFWVQQITNPEPVLKIFDQLWNFGDCYRGLCNDGPCGTIDEKTHLRAAGPLLNRQDIYNSWLDKISRAKHHITIVSPYFFPSRRLLRELNSAARRGVAIEIITPNHSDHTWYDHMRSISLSLLARSAKIWLTPHYFHQKLLSVDNSWSVGSANFDLISTHRSFELNVEGEHGPILKAIRSIAADNRNKRETRKYTPPVRWLNWQWAYPILEYLVAKVSLFR